MKWWLMKSEPSEVSIEDLAQAPSQRVGWFGVRNYQARNFMRDDMTPGDLAFFYHSSCAVPGIAGIVKIVSPAVPDPTQFDTASPYFDPKAQRETPRWVQVEVELVEKTRFVPLTELRTRPELAGMILLRRGNRLSITPLTSDEGDFLFRWLRGSAASSK